jgi:plastocyanin
MYELDSRSLGPFDCYSLRFPRPGTYPYAVTRTGLRGLTADRPFTVIVTDDRPDEIAQHDVTVTWTGRELVADPAELTITTGDVVLWHGDGAGVPFEIHGDDDLIDSGSLRDQSGYTHFFGNPGRYTWIDANGSGLRGSITVRDPEAAGPRGRARWLAQLSQGHVVTIDGEKAEPAELEIVTGQTVYFAVVAAPGITVTDESLPPGTP